MPVSSDAADGGALLAILRARIAREGPLTVAQYMAVCVADPRHGYWHGAHSIGREGDFITAPEISQTFGELIGLWVAVTWQAMGSPDPVRVIELGPGRGTLMRDALRAMRAVPGLPAAVRVELVEISPALREAQREVLALAGDGGPPVHWHADLADVPDGPAIAIGNEFLDSLPVRQLVRDGGVWRERVVALDAADGLAFALGERVECDDAGPAPEGAILELRPGEAALLATLARRAGAMAALFIDYGPAAPGFGDTLQAVRRHAFADPLVAPGTADLTTHVQFAGFAAAARAAGLAVDGPMPQGEFLGRLGIVERASRLMALNPGVAAEIEAGVQRLISPTGMGSLFKVMAVRVPALPPLVPFG